MSFTKLLTHSKISEVLVFSDEHRGCRLAVRHSDVLRSVITIRPIECTECAPPVIQLLPQPPPPPPAPRALRNQRLLQLAMDETEGNSSMDSNNREPAGSPRPLATPRNIACVVDTPLSTKREKQAMTPRFRRPAPKVIRTAPPTRSIVAHRQTTFPQLVTPQGQKPLSSPKYDRLKNISFFEQVFKVVEIVGRGSFGEVFAAQSLEDSTFYAVKVSINTIRQYNPKKFREVETHMSIPPHKNIVKFYRAWEESGRLFIQTELCEMSLLHYCTKKHALPEDEVWNIFIDLLRAVHHLHENELVHDDIKPENIFLTKDYICKLGDFGLVINLKDPVDISSAEEGDSKYLAPEVLNGKPSKSSDIFSLGMTILEATTDLDMPSNGLSWHQIRQGQIPDRFFNGCSQDLRQLIAHMLQYEAEDRPSSHELLKHPAIKKRLLKRDAYISYIEARNGFLNFLSIMLVWCIAFFSVVFHPIARFHQAIRDRRYQISTNYMTQTQQQQTPIHTPESASRIFSQSLVGSSIVRSQVVSPFDFSDDENPSTSSAAAAAAASPGAGAAPSTSSNGVVPSSENSKRRLFDARISRRLNFDDDDDENQATSSSNSSAISADSTSSPSRVITTSPPGTPKRDRRMLSRPTSPIDDFNHRGAGDSFAHSPQLQKTAAQEKTEKYMRMRRAEQLLDWNDNANVINEALPPMSCPPQINRKDPRRPIISRLNFNILDGNSSSTSSGAAGTPPPPLTKPDQRLLRRSLRPKPRPRMMSFHGSSGDEI